MITLGTGTHDLGSYLRWRETDYVVDTSNGGKSKNGLISSTSNGDMS